MALWENAGFLWITNYVNRGPHVKTLSDEAVDNLTLESQTGEDRNAGRP